MKIENFLKDKIIQILLLLFAITTIEIFLIPYNYENFIKFYIPTIIIFIYTISLTIEYIIKRNFYSNLLNTIDELEEKYLVNEIIKTPNFIEGRILKNSLEQIDKSMIENVNKYKYRLQDYKDYIELWIHEIKLPIASRKNDNRKQQKFSYKKY